MDRASELETDFILASPGGVTTNNEVEQFTPGVVYNKSGCFVPYDASQAALQSGQQECLHYVPPSAISTRYYTLSNPNVYTVTGQFPAVHNGIPVPTGSATTNAANTEAATGITRHTPATSRSPTLANPVLPKQRRNRDDPGGESRPQAQPTTQHKDQAAGSSSSAGSSQAARVESPPAIVPSQWKLGAALDQIRFGSHPSGWGAIRATPPAFASEPTHFQADIVDFKTKRGIRERIARADDRPAASSSTSSATGAEGDGDLNMNRSAIYSPTTGRKLALSAEPGKASVQIVPGTTSAKRPYKRGTPVACAFCRKRKIACGGPQEGDEMRRCG
ncbi:hypothetical protein C8Q77DRAFT_1075471 [Trametes polyzona]|nr:hypothetical protein C8Q77DRAFT_1075471 [Trametes polyzona]